MPGQINVMVNGKYILFCQKSDNIKKGDLRNMSNNVTTFRKQHDFSLL